jgi:hypothetical protein
MIILLFKSTGWTCSSHQQFKLCEERRGHRSNQEKDIYENSKPADTSSIQIPDLRSKIEEDYGQNEEQKDVLF